MSKKKILSKIKNNITRKVPLKAFSLKAVTYKNPYKEFLKNFIASGGELTTKEKGKVLKAEFGIAENGAVLLCEIENRQDYTYHEELTILLDKNSVLDNMHQAYKKININSFALFMAGPSKTADIEQSLVIGAHGAKRVYLMEES